MSGKTVNLGERIMILGSAGSGKSTLAKRLGQITRLPVIHLDCLFWKPDWVARPAEEIDKMILNAAAAEKWIIDGNYLRTMDARLERADTVIFLDFNKLFCIYRVIKRRIKYRGKTRGDIAEGCKEKIDKEFLLWIWNFPKKQRKKILEKISDSSIIKNKNIYHLKTRKQVKKFIKSVTENRERNVFNSYK